VRKGLSKGDLVLLAPPADTAGIRSNKLAGLKPVAAQSAAPVATGADSAKKQTVPVNPKH
jgi:hypothetical protein